MTIEDVHVFMRDHPGEMMPMPNGGSIHPRFALDILEGRADNYEPIDILKKWKAELQ